MNLVSAMHSYFWRSKVDINRLVIASAFYLGRGIVYRGLYVEVKGGRLSKG